VEELQPVPTNLITQVTRRKIFDTIALSKVYWPGRLEEPDFLARIYDLDAMASTDSRYRSAAGDIRQHRVNNPEDWPDDWIFTDSRFGLQHGDDKLVLQFIAEMLHPVVRPDEEQVAALLRSFNEVLARDGTSYIQLIGSAVTLSTVGDNETLSMAQTRSFGFVSVRS
jgi:hypothetical protein